MTQNTTVEVSSLQKRYGRVQVVKGIDFSIRKGEVMGFLGPNGAGKTTTVLMLTTYLSPDNGTIKIGGKSMGNEKEHGAIQRYIGYVPQEISLYGELNSIENLVFFGRLYGVKGPALKERTAKLLELVGLSDKSRQPVKQFSGGMQRRLNIALALLHNPKFVILDEPTVGIDPQSRNRIFDIVNSLKNDGVSVLYITHYMEEAQSLCDRVAIMDDGNIVALDTIDGLLQTVAGRHVLNVEIDGWNEASNAELKKKYAASEVGYSNGVLSVHISDVKGVIPRLISDLYNTGLTVKKIDIKEPDLQQVFLQLTGKALRD